MKTGACGLGNMGAAMARRMMDVGYDLTLWNKIIIIKNYPLSSEACQVPE